MEETSKIQQGVGRNGDESTMTTPCHDLNAADSTCYDLPIPFGFTLEFDHAQLYLIERTK